MLKYLRYALATFCFAASVGCLALWWRADARRVYIGGLYFEAWAGTGVFSLDRENLFASMSDRKAINNEELRAAIAEEKIRRSRLGNFGQFRRSLYFPLWYPPLIFTLAGIAALRLGRRFTLRSAIIATTVVAGLLGTAVAS